ncbi:LysR family substrate-binding domain-containing protein [Cellulomonas cellasea]|uniref:LysR family substrate-binding domain-containing protein n=1 Tax=Cellulomonas cellasea TaxID=43670 RepID=UPI0025A344D2|nr:LysR family substrate-binding domain-containing protein [Cellulomonas cellasea]MDM8085341.1 LysR family substrate-binding domain-containing protein [Cellulomonas cellasea]
MDEHGSSETEGPFRLLVVPGATPAKWVRVWKERLPDVRLELVHAEVEDQARALHEGRADAALVRLPIDRAGLSAIPLYTETSVVIVPRDHLLTAAEEVTVDDLADELLVVPLDDTLDWRDAPGTRLDVEAPATTADAVALVAAGVGVLVAPQSLARLHHRRDVTYRPVPEAPTSSVALAWVEDRTTDLVEELVGIVRGRTVNSSRGRGAGAAGAVAATAGGSERRATDKRSTSGKAAAAGKAATAGKRATPGKGGTAGKGGGAARGKGRRGR